MDVPASLCFVASIGDSLLMEQLLKSGMDPNESDCNSCTPLVNFKIKIHFDHYSFMVFLFLATLLLHSCDSYVQYFLISRHNWLKLSILFCFCYQHIATANGFNDCVNLLLEYGVDVNSKGIFSLPHCTCWFFVQSRSVFLSINICTKTISQAHSIQCLFKFQTVASVT